MDQVTPPPVNRPVRTRMPGGVGRAGERPALTRFMCRFRFTIDLQNLRFQLFDQLVLSLQF